MEGCVGLMVERGTGGRKRTYGVDEGCGRKTKDDYGVNVKVEMLRRRRC